MSIINSDSEGGRQDRLRIAEVQRTAETLIESLGDPPLKEIYALKVARRMVSGELNGEKVKLVIDTALRLAWKGKLEKWPAAYFVGVMKNEFDELGLEWDL